MVAGLAAGVVRQWLRKSRARSGSFPTAPRITLTAAPGEPGGHGLLRLQDRWSGYDPDGRIAYYQYAIDPKGRCDSRNDVDPRPRTVIFFRLHSRHEQRPDLSGQRKPRTFVIRAFDDDNERSPHRSRSFFAYDSADRQHREPDAFSPRCRRERRPRSHLVGRQGRDGVFAEAGEVTNYRLLGPATPVSMVSRFSIARRSPLLRRQNFAGWDSTSTETTFAQFTNLTPSSGGGSYLLFIVVGFDEAGAYSADWSLDNMLRVLVGYAGNARPYHRACSTSSSTIWPAVQRLRAERRSFRLGAHQRLPATIPVTVNWFTIAPEGDDRVVSLATRVDVDGRLRCTNRVHLVFDQERRHDEVPYRSVPSGAVVARVCPWRCTSGDGQYGHQVQSASRWLRRRRSTAVADRGRHATGTHLTTNGTRKNYDGLARGGDRHVNSTPSAARTGVVR